MQELVLPCLPLEPHFCALAIAATVQHDDGVMRAPFYREHFKGEFLFYASRRCLPLALNDEAVGPTVRVVNDKVHAPVFSIDIKASHALLGEDGLAQFSQSKKSNGGNSLIFIVQ